MIVGLDFDNTIVDYNGLFYTAARDAGLLPHLVEPTKTAVRDCLRSLDGGEIVWQKLQAEVYGPRINEAVLFSGVPDFLYACKASKISVCVVSHKTRFARRGNMDLREAAIGFMEDKGLFDMGPYGLSRDRVYFADTRREKVNIISSLGCNVFIDDLVEVLEEPSFPSGVSRYLFDPFGEKNNAAIRSVSSWAEFSACFFQEESNEG